MYRKVHIILLTFSLLHLTCRAQRLSLFHEDVKTAMPSIVYDFLERYLYVIDSLERKGEIVQQRLRDDKVTFVVGYPSVARQISQTTPFTITKYEDGKSCEISWTGKNDKVLLDIVFPMSYELLLGMSKEQIEQNLAQEIKKFNNYTSNDSVYVDMPKAEDGCLIYSMGDAPDVPELGRSMYYWQDKSGFFYPVFSKKDRVHSAANLFHGCIEDVDRYNLSVVQKMYGKKTHSFSISLRQWLAYCQSMKLDTYFAVEHSTAESLKVLVVAQSKELNFNHMLSVNIPSSFVDNPKNTMECTLNAYIPTHNIKNLYQNYLEQNSSTNSK